MRRGHDPDRLEMRVEIGPGLGYLVRFDNRASLEVYNETMTEVNRMLDTRPGEALELASLRQELALCRERLERMEKERR